MAEKYLMTKSSEDTSALFGAFDANIRLIEGAFNVRVSNRRGGGDKEGDEIVISGEGESLSLAHKTLGTYEGGAVRASFGIYNDIDQIEVLATALREIIKQ